MSIADKTKNESDDLIQWNQPKPKIFMSRLVSDPDGQLNGAYYSQRRTLNGLDVTVVTIPTK